MELSLKEKGRYEKFVREHGNLWQSWGWGEFQESVGRKVYRFGIEHDKGFLVVAQVVQHDLPLGRKYFYVSRGPIMGSEGIKGTEGLIDEIVEFARKEGALFVKFDGINRDEIGPQYRVRVSSSVQPERSIVIDLKQEEKEILAHMKQKGRYNVRLAQKRGVELKAVSSKQGGKLKIQDSKLKDYRKSVQEFFGLLKETTKRDEFRGHGISYYEKMLKHLDEDVELIMAYFDGKPVAGGIFTFYGKTAVYYYGASADEYRSVMAPYLVQWTAIQEAKKRGCEYYDFLGVAPEGAKNHPWAGVTEFKEKFGGERILFTQPFDVVLKPMWYVIYRLVR